LYGLQFPALVDGLTITQHPKSAAFVDVPGLFSRHYRPSFPFLGFAQRAFAAWLAIRLRSAGEIFSIRALAAFFDMREKYADSFLSFMPALYAHRVSMSRESYFILRLSQAFSSGPFQR
jgi:hypothetical protein